MHVAVFANNPHVSGFRPSRSLEIERSIGGHGHLIQRLQKRLGLPAEGPPKPEIYLNMAETEWARRERLKWPAERPTCFLATRAMTHADIYSTVDWDWLGSLLSQGATIIQAVLTHPPLSTDQRQPGAGTLGPEHVVPGAVRYENLTVRQFVSLLSVVDCFCGGMSGGTHVAAAFDLPSLILVPDRLKRRLVFPISSTGYCPEMFLYPQHHYASLEDIRPRTDRCPVVVSAVTRLLADATLKRGRGFPCNAMNLSPAMNVERQSVCQEQFR